MNRIRLLRLIIFIGSINTVRPLHLVNKDFEIALLSNS